MSILCGSFLGSLVGFCVAKVPHRGGFDACSVLFSLNKFLIVRQNMFFCSFGYMFTEGLGLLLYI